MRRFVSLAVLLLFAVPFGVSISGCSKAVPVTYCNGQTSGVVVGQLTTLNLEPRLTGISLNQGEIGRASSPSGRDCKGNIAAAFGVVYATSNLSLADIDPVNGTLCGGTWNRNTGGGIPDYTVCTPTTQSGTAQLTASADGVVSNPIPVYIHPIVTSIVLGPASTDCTADPASNCALDASQRNGCSPAAPLITPAQTYTGLSCLSQGSGLDLVARTYRNNSTSAANNISCLVGPLTFSANNASVVTLGIDPNNSLATLATAAQPGTSTINANISQAASNAGFFATCPPKSIVLTTPNATAPPTGPISVNQNTAQTLNAIVTDTNGKQLTNVQLEYVSTSPTVIPANSNVITPTYPGAAAITAICQPPICNYSPFDKIGLFGNSTPPAPTGTAVTSNPVQINAVGTNFSTILYIASTQSQYLLPIDFTVATQPSPVRLPFAPNSMVISQDLSTIYMGNANEIMIFSTFSNSLVKQDVTIQGSVLAVSPDNNTVIVTDPARKLTYLYLASGGIATEYGGVATRAQWSPDSQTVYITTTDGRLLVYSSFTGWSSVPLTTLATDVAITVPNAGVYLGGAPVDVRTNCPLTTVNNPANGNPALGFLQTTTNVFYPDLGPVAATATRLAATNDGVHILGASTSAFTDIRTNQKSGGCPVTFTSTPQTPIPFTTILPTAVQNVFITSDSAYAFVTYQGTGSAIPQYAPATGALTNVALLPGTAVGSPQPTAPISGVLSTDNNTLFVGTSNDNGVHLLTRGASGFTDSVKTITPALPGLNGGTAPPDLIVQRPRKSTS